jgi:hypothetical protein
MESSTTPTPPPVPIPPQAEAMAPEEVDDDSDLVEENGEVPDDVLATLREAQVEVQPLGKTKILEVPGYKGLLAIEYQYIGSEVTENIARKVRRQTRAIDGRGSGLLSAIDTLRASCKRVVCRRTTDDKKWMSVGGKKLPVVRLDLTLARLLNFDAEDGRDVVLQLFGSEHAITNANLIISSWMTDQTRQMDEDFLA